jgi:hypothetical protein
MHHGTVLCPGYQAGKPYKASSTSNRNEALASIVCIEELQILCGGSVIGYD